MKLVESVYDEKMYVVGKVETGYFFGEQNDLLVDVNEVVLKDYLEAKEDYGSFLEYLDEREIEYKSLPSNNYYSEASIEEWIKDWKYFYNANDDSLSASSEIKIYPLCDYIERYINGSYEDKEVVEISDLELVESDIKGYSSNKIGQLDLYKDGKGNLILNNVSYYQGDLGYAEYIDATTLLNDYNYIYAE